VRFCTFDIECSDLKSDKSFMLCAGFKPYGGGKKKIISLKSVGKFGQGRRHIDKYLVEQVKAELESYDGLIGWNSIMFDVPYLNDRLMFAGLDPVRKMFHIDVMYQARRGKSMMTSSRLDWVARSLGCPMMKTPLDLNTWLDAEEEARLRFKEGSKAFDQIIHHNDADLDVTEWVYDVLKRRVSVIQKR
jgi:uncharacterized protein YprB with RNaseH-like and TPR domain